MSELAAQLRTSLVCRVCVQEFKYTVTVPCRHICHFHRQYSMQMEMHTPVWYSNLYLDVRNLLAGCVTSIDAPSPLGDALK